MSTKAKSKLLDHGVLSSQCKSNVKLDLFYLFSYNLDFSLSSLQGRASSSIDNTQGRPKTVGDIGSHGVLLQLKLKVSNFLLDCGLRI